MSQEEERLFAELHSALNAYIIHRLGEGTQADDVYEQLIDEIIAVTE